MASLAGVLGIVILVCLVAIAAALAALSWALVWDEIDRIVRHRRQRIDMDRLEEMVRHPSGSRKR